MGLLKRSEWIGRLAARNHMGNQIKPRLAPLRPISKAQALKEVVEQSLDLELRGKPGFDLIAHMVSSGQWCYSLDCYSLRKAVSLVERLTL